MKPVDPSLLEVREVGDLSYSSWSRMRICQLKAAFSMEPKTKVLDRGGVLSAIGNARHRLAETVSGGRRNGREPPPSAWVRIQFDQLLSEERTGLIAQWSPADVPAIRTWPDIALTRAKLARGLGSTDGAPWPELTDLQEKKARAPRVPSQLGLQGLLEPPGVGEAATEVTLRDNDHGFWGRIDRLENRAGTLAVVDLKSGVGVPREQLADRHRLQMLFYAGLINAAYGTWPVLELAPVSGGPVSIDYEPAEVEAVRGAAAKDRDELNTMVEEGSFRAEVQATPTRCAWCPFQVACPALLDRWGALAFPKYMPLHPAVSLSRGEVTEVRRHHSSTELVIAQAEELTAPAGPVIVTRLPSGLEVSVGAELAVSRVSPSASDRVLRATWNSPIWPVPPG